jgi:hypothetical protein
VLLLSQLLLLSVRGGEPYMGISAISLGLYGVYRSGSEVPYKRAQSEAKAPSEVNGDQTHLYDHDDGLGAIRSPQLTEYSPHVVLDGGGA